MKLLDPRRYSPGSPGWQFCLILQNLGDPRLGNGLAIFAWLIGLITFSYALLFHWALSLPQNHHEQRNQPEHTRIG